MPACGPSREELRQLTRTQPWAECCASGEAVRTNACIGDSAERDSKGEGEASPHATPARDAEAAQGPGPDPCHACMPSRISVPCMHAEQHLCAMHAEPHLCAMHACPAASLCHACMPSSTSAPCMPSCISVPCMHAQPHLCSMHACRGHVAGSTAGGP
eukprot:366078-Chlamydomonas_euryale.AAC.10